MKLLDRIKAKVIGRNTNLGDAGSYQSNMATFVGVQLKPSVENLSDAFPRFMNDLWAAGYLFGFHLACARSIYRGNTDKCLVEIERSYVGIFGEPAGRFLFSRVNIDRVLPDFLSGLKQGEGEMCTLLEGGVRPFDPLTLSRVLPFGLKDHIERDCRQANALAKFEMLISTWDPEQARMALALLGELAMGDRGPLESIYGKGAKSQEVIRHLQVGHMHVLLATIEEITGERT